MNIHCKSYFGDWLASICIVGMIFTCTAEADDIALKSQMVKMRDGVHLSTDVYFKGEINKARPTIFIRTVYSKQQAFGWNQVWQNLIDQDYAVVIQDIRGRFESEGLIASLVVEERTAGIL